MPNMNGIELCRQLRSHEQHQDTPIIMITATADDLDKALKQELNLIVLPKPQGLTNLSDTIAQTVTPPDA